MQSSLPAAPAVNPKPAVRDCGFGVLVLDLPRVVRGEVRTDSYFVERIACDDLAYQLTKTDPLLCGTDPEADGYAVNLTHSTCECRGHLRWGHCKHVEAVRAAYERGDLS